MKRILGIDLAEQEIERILRQLGFGVTPGLPAKPQPSGLVHTAGSGGAHAAVVEAVSDFSVTVPTWRLDVEREIDLLEELARIYGYNKFPNTLPSFAGAVVALPDEAEECEGARDHAGAGLRRGHLDHVHLRAEDARTFGSWPSRWRWPIL